MPEIHLTQRDLRGFFAGSLSGERNRAVVRHLLTSCPECSQLAAGFWPPPRESAEALGAMYGTVQDGVKGRLGEVERDREAAAALYDELMTHPGPRRSVLARNSRRYRNWFLCERVVEEAFEAGFDSPQVATELAELGVTLAESLDETSYPRSLAADLQARARATLGNARRICSDFPAARQELERAVDLLQQGTGDPLEEGRVLTFWAHYHTARARYGEAERLLRLAERRFRSVGDDHLASQTMVHRGTALGQAGRHEEAIRLIENGLGALDATRTPRMALAAKHNLAVLRSESGDLETAMSLIKELLPLHAARQERMNLIRLRWLEGRLAQAQGEPTRAEQAYEDVQRAFLDREMPHDAALASLDLATVLLEQGRLSDLKRLAAEIVPLFQVLEVHREALVAAALFRKAVELEQVTVRWIGELASFLERSRTDPKLRFEPPAPRV